MPREARGYDMHRAGTWTGSKSFVFAIRTEKSLLRSKSEFNISIGSSAYKSCPGLTTLIGGSASHSGCPSLNKRSLPRLAPPCQSLSKCVDLIIMTTGKGQQLRDKRVEPRSVLGQ